MSNALKTENKIYDFNDIYAFTTEYISTLSSADDIYNKQCFNGLIKYIALKINITDNHLANIDYLNTLWDIYTTLCYKYKNPITTTRFCVLISTHRETLNRWKKGEYRNDYSDKLSMSRCDILKKWHNEAEGSLESESLNGNIGAIFGLKAGYGWQEQQQTEHIHRHVVERTADQIAGDYNIPALESDTI